VCNPDEAINAYLRTNMDMLVLGNYVVERNGN
jgi:predicted NodU family carbamoyl transferase